ncbi:MAG: GNAT family N-acetyltransferase [Pseudomonadota bacterium]
MAEVEVRAARLEDAGAVSEMLFALKAAGKRTRPCEVEFVRDHYIANPRNILCALVFDSQAVIGLQALSFSYEGNPYGAAPEHGIIGTHVAPLAARRGVGRAMFAKTLEAARGAGLAGIEAYIQKSNAEGHGYYGRMGFEPLREDGTALVRLYQL